VSKGVPSGTPQYFQTSMSAFARIAELTNPQRAGEASPRGVTEAHRKSAIRM